MIHGNPPPDDVEVVGVVGVVPPPVPVLVPVFEPELDPEVEDVFEPEEVGGGGGLDPEANDIPVTGLFLIEDLMSYQK